MQLPWRRERPPGTHKVQQQNSDIAPYCFHPSRHRTLRSCKEACHLPNATDVLAHVSIDACALQRGLAPRVFEYLFQKIQEEEGKQVRQAPPADSACTALRDCLALQQP